MEDQNEMKTEVAAVDFEYDWDGIVAVAASCRGHQAYHPVLGHW